MALSLATVGAKITATFINLIIGKVNLQGTTKLIPTAGTGATVSSTGTVSFTAQASISIDGLDSTYKNHVIVFRSLQSASADVQFLVRTAAADVTSANYNSQMKIINGAGADTNSQTLAAALGTVMVTHGAANAYIRGRMEITGLTIAEPTTVNALLSSHIGNTSARNNICMVDQSLSTAYTGLTIKFSAGTGTGEFTIYGYNA